MRRLLRLLAPRPIALALPAHDDDGGRQDEPPAAASHAAHNPVNDVEGQAKKPDTGGKPMEH